MNGSDSTRQEEDVGKLQNYQINLEIDEPWSLNKVRVFYGRVVTEETFIDSHVGIILRGSISITGRIFDCRHHADIIYVGLRFFH